MSHGRAASASHAPDRLGWLGVPAPRARGPLPEPAQLTLVPQFDSRRFGLHSLQHPLQVLAQGLFSAATDRDEGGACDKRHDGGEQRVDDCRRPGTWPSRSPRNPALLPHSQRASLRETRRTALARVTNASTIAYHSQVKAPSGLLSSNPGGRCRSPDHAWPCVDRGYSACGSVRCHCACNSSRRSRVVDLDGPHGHLCGQFRPPPLRGRTQKQCACQAEPPQ